MSDQPDPWTARVRAVLTIGAILAAGALTLALILHAPFALLRADYARPIWGASAESSGRWSFGIGHAF
jgi:outer membrane protein assembly factor BamA